MRRLTTVLPFLNGFKTLLDVGTDHALLPVMALEEGWIKKAYASDNKDGPLEMASKTLENKVLKDKIILLKGDGLDVLKDDVDVCVIAGMGGKTIQKILLNADFKNIERFIIQPTNHLKSVRSLTHLKGLYIKDELLVMEKEIPYITMILDRGCAPLDDKGLYFGTHLIERKDENYHRILSQDITFLESLLSKIPEGKKSKEMVQKAQYLKEILDDWS